jgi:DNA-binding FadR family transcriptional regulator
MLSGNYPAAVPPPRAVRVAHELVQAIRNGTHPIGTALPSEADLGERFGISRPSVREALSALQFGGYISSQRGLASVVIADRPRLTTTDNAAASWAEVADLLAARLVVEPAAAGIAAEDPDQRALDEAHQLARGMSIAVATPDFADATDHRLHAAVARICRNTVLVEQIEVLLQRASGPLWQAGQRTAWDDERALRAWTNDHLRLIGAIADGDSAAAASIVRQHLQAAVRNVLGVDDLPPSVRRRLERTSTVPQR